MNNSAFKNRSLQILVVENHPDTLHGLVLYLQMRGHSVVTADSVQNALEVLASAPCDVLLADIGLPDGSGWDLLNLQKLPTPIFPIAMSGFGTNADLEKSEKAGYRAHLIKPFDPKLLDELLIQAREELTVRIEAER